MADPDNLPADDGGADDRLRALFAPDAPPARDPAFSVAVMAAVMRRRFLGDVARLVGVTGLGGVILWLLWPVLTPAITSLSQGLAPVAAGLTLAAIVVLVTAGREALGFEHD